MSSSTNIIKDFFKVFSIMVIFIIIIQMIRYEYFENDDSEEEVLQPVIIYQVDNAGAELVGTITDKEIIEGRYTVTVEAYGKFLVTKEQYDDVRVGDDIPEYLKGKGN